MNDFVFLNGEYLKGAETRVSVFDRGFTYGDGIFETLRAYNGRPFLLALHLERLKKGARALCIPLKTEETQWNSIIARLIELNSLDRVDSYIRITVTRGLDPGGLTPQEGIKPTELVVNKPLSSAIEEKQQKGIKGTILSAKGKQPYNVAGIKSLNFLTNLMGKIEASKRGADEGIFLNPEGNITEGTTTNIFIFRGDRLITPPLQAGILPGITRQIVTDLAKEEFEVSEKEVTREDLYLSEEAFVTNSLIEVTPLVKVDGKPIGHGEPGDRTKRLQRRYREKIEKKVQS